MQVVPGSSPFRFNGTLAGSWPQPLPALVEPLVERLMSLDALEAAYRRLPPALRGAEFARRALELLDVRFETDALAMARIPPVGPLVVVANHPIGGLEGLFLMAFLGRRRSDLRVLGNSLLSRVPELADQLIAVDVLERAVVRNARALRVALRHLHAGGALLVFPAGEVSHLHAHSQAVIDPPWSPTAARLALAASATVVPVMFEAGNSAGFQLAGLVHPRLRTLLLPREMLNKRRRRVAVHIGPVLEPVALGRLGAPAVVTRHLRIVTYALGLRGAAPSAVPPVTTAAPIAQPATDRSVAREVEQLPPARTLARQGALRVLHFRAAEAPAALAEVGRLRELTFRAVGEGSGRAVDLDRFDADYDHVLLWDEQLRRIAGGYRLGRVQEIVARRGLDGLYTRTLFHYDSRLLGRLGPSLELGRSFVRIEYQRRFAPLLLLWKGIAQFLVGQTRCHTLFGPVSLSANFAPAAVQLMLEYLRLRYRAADLARLVEPRTPPIMSWNIGRLRLPLSAVEDADELDAVVAALQPDGAGVPVLLRQYLKLGARFIGSNVDGAFGHATDCLMAVDLRATATRLLARYLDADGLRRFGELHPAAAVRVLQEAPAGVVARSS